MKFYGKDIQQDHLFIKVLNQSNYAYWIASDLDHFVDSKDNISPYEYYKLINQYNLSIDILNRSDTQSNELDGDHKKCAVALSNFIKISLRNFKFFDTKIRSNSELKEILYIETIDQEKDFHEIYLHYLPEISAERAALKSFSYMSETVSDILMLDTEYDIEENNKISKKISKNFKLAKEEVEIALMNPSHFDYIINDLNIINAFSSDKLSKNNFKTLVDKNIYYLSLWKEFYYINEHFYYDLFSNKKDLEVTDFKLFDYESQKYSSEINNIAIDKTSYLLKYMNINIPNIEIFSNRLNKNIMKLLKI